MNMKLALNSWLAAVAASISLNGPAGMSQPDRGSLAGAGIGGIAGALLTDGSVSGALGGAAATRIIGHLMTPRKDVHGNDPYPGNGHTKGERCGYNSRSRQGRGFGYNNGSGYTSGDRYESTSNEWLGS